jgi:hypothetical protein
VPLPGVTTINRATSRRLVTKKIALGHLAPTASVKLRRRAAMAILVAPARVVKAKALAHVAMVIDPKVVHAAKAIVPTVLRRNDPMARRRAAKAKVVDHRSDKAWGPVLVRRAKPTSNG